MSTDASSTDASSTDASGADAALAEDDLLPHPRTLVAAAHGTASIPGQETIAALIDEIQKLRPDLPIRLCFLDVLAPALGDVLASEPDAVVVPMLLCTGYHVLQDIPAIARFYPDVSVTPHLGPHRALSQALADRLSELELADGSALNTDSASAKDGTKVRAIALIAGGSSVAAATEDLAAAAVDLAELTGHEVYPLTIGDALPDQLAELQVSAVATYLLAEGYFFHRLKTIVGPHAPVSPVIGAHPEVAKLILQRYDDALSATL